MIKGRVEAEKSDNQIDRYAHEEKLICQTNIALTHCIFEKVMVLTPIYDIVICCVLQHF